VKGVSLVEREGHGRLAAGCFLAGFGPREGLGSVVRRRFVERRVLQRHPQRLRKLLREQHAGRFRIELFDQLLVALCTARIAH